MVFWLTIIASPWFFLFQSFCCRFAPGLRIIVLCMTQFGYHEMWCYALWPNISTLISQPKAHCSLSFTVCSFAYCSLVKSSNMRTGLLGLMMFITDILIFNSIKYLKIGYIFVDFWHCHFKRCQSPSLLFTACCNKTVNLLYSLLYLCSRMEVFAEKALSFRREWRVIGG